MSRKPSARAAALAEIRSAIVQRQRFVVSSHARPDGDSIGSQLAMVYALRSLGKTVRVVNADPAPPQLAEFPGVSGIEIAPAVQGNFDAAIIMECGTLARTGVEGLDRYHVINIDHHPGNTMYGALNWFDESAAACAEMVFDIIGALEVPLSLDIATHIYLAILTDTGGFHFSHISARTFDICRQAVEAGVNAERVARMVFDSSTLGRLKLLSAVLGSMELELDGRLAIVRLSQEMLAKTGGSLEDSEGLINQPLTVKDIEAVAFFKEVEPELYRVSMRSKGDVDVGAVAKELGGGGHRNAAGCTMAGAYEHIRDDLVGRVRGVLDPTPASDRA